MSNIALIGFSTLLLILSGIFSGLTIGFFSLNATDLKHLADAGNKDAKKIYRLRKRGSLLLVSLLLGNVVVNSVLSIMLGFTLSGTIGAITATILIVLIGEIIPQATFAKHALKITSIFTPAVRILTLVLFPVSWPIATVLDWALGEEKAKILSKKEFKQIIKFHQKSKDSNIDDDESRIMIGALSFSHKTVKDIYKEKEKVFTVTAEQQIDTAFLEKIKQQGFTRIPVKEENNIIGMLYAKDLIGYKEGEMVGDVMRKNKIIEVKDGAKLDRLLNKFTAKKVHIAVVTSKSGGFKGIVTLEDVIEEIINKEIEDELD